MAIAFVEGYSVYSAGASSVTLTKPVGLAAGDVLIAICHWNGNRTISDNNGAYAFTAAYGGGVNGTGATYRIFYRVAGASEPASYNFTSSASDRVSGVILAYRGVDTTTVFDQVPDADSEWNGSTTTTAVTNAITTLNDGAMVIALCFADSTATMTSPTAPTNFTYRYDTIDQHILSADYEDVVKGTIAADDFSFSFAGAVNCSTQIFSLLPEATGGTEYNQSAAGTLTSAGTVVKKTGKPTAGTITSAGGVAFQISKVVSGALTTAGTIANQISKSLAGSLSSSGILDATKTALLSLAGTLSTSGTVAKQTNKTLSGAVTSSATLIKSVGKIIAGAVTSAGELLGELTVGATTYLQSLAGTLTASGTVAKSTTKLFSGVLNTSGTITRAISKVVSGTMTTAGAIAKRTSKTVAGAIAWVGDVTGVSGVIKAVSLGLLPTRSLANSLFSRSTSVTLPNRDGVGFALDDRDNSFVLETRKELLND